MSESLKNLGEFGLIDRISRKFVDNVGSGITGIGDDAAIIPHADGSVQLVTCDTLIENIHFCTDAISPEHLGYKSLAVNLSDIAAMGGKPDYVFLALAVPVSTSVNWIDSFMEGFYELTADHNVPLLGGDTTRTEHKIMITCTVIGSAKADHVKTRSDARPGDHIMVTGPLGDSGGGLKLLMKGEKSGSAFGKQLVRAHNQPYPFVREGLWLGENQSVNAMIDISDGLTSDAGHIATSSDVTMEIEIENLPISEALKEAAGHYGFDALDLALSAGEDFRLLFTVPQSEASSLEKEYKHEFGRSLFHLGTVKKGKAKVVITKEGKELRYQAGFDHFKK